MLLDATDTCSSLVFVGGRHTLLCNHLGGLLSGRARGTLVRAH